jgi:Uma2 family endonuclease
MVATRQVTVEEFAEMPLQGIWELVDGEPIELSPAAGRSGWISATIVALLANHVRQSRLGWAFSAETGFVLFEDRQTVRSPDAAVVLRNRLAELPDSFVPMAPDLAAEVLSPSDRIADALAKVAMYLQAGTALVWLVNPATRTVVVFRSEMDPVTLGASDILDGGDILPGFSVSVSEIFADA